MPAELLALMQRYNALGRLLPAKDDWDVVLEDPHARAEAELVLAEMHLTKAAIDDFLAAVSRRSA